MTRLEAVAISLHDHIWKNMGITDDWPLHLSGDDAEVTRLITLLNLLQDEIKSSGYARMKYTSK